MPTDGVLLWSGTRTPDQYDEPMLMAVERSPSMSNVPSNPLRVAAIE